MSSFTHVTKVPIPAYVAPEAVLSALHAYRPLIEANPHLVTYERRAVGVSEVLNDPFFTESGTHLQAFTIYQRIAIIPGVGSWATKEVLVPCVFQSFEAGARCRADAGAGVTVWSSYEVRRRGEVKGSEPELPQGPGDGLYELVEIAKIECGALVKPFVKRSFSGAHLEILQRVVEAVAKGYQAQVRATSVYEPQGAPYGDVPDGQWNRHSSAAAYDTQLSGNGGSGGYDYGRQSAYEVPQRQSPPSRLGAPSYQRKSAADQQSQGNFI